MDFTLFENNVTYSKIAKIILIIPFCILSAVLLSLIPTKLFVILIFILILLIYIFAQDIHTKIVNHIPHLTKFIGFINMDMDKLPKDSTDDEYDDDDDISDVDQFTSSQSSNTEINQEKNNKTKLTFPAKKVAKQNTL
jgi:hypothetical protein